MARVVVSGGAGFIGSHLCRSLLERGDEVVCVDNLLTGSAANVAELTDATGFEFVQHDVTTPVEVAGAVDAVMHFASPASPADFARIPLEILDVGSNGTRNLLELAHKKAARFMVASTSEVYGDPLVHPQPETYWGNVNSIGPRSVYDEAKRFAEAITMAYHRLHDLDVRILRIFNSVLADEMVVYDDGRELRHETIEAAARRLAQNPNSALRVPAFDRSGAISASPASALVGHPTTATCYRVRTRYGRSIRVTGDHSLFAEGEGGRPEARAARDLRCGDRIALAGRIDVPERDRPEVRLSEVWDAAGRDPWDLIVSAPRLGLLLWERRHELAAAFRTNGRSAARDPSRAAWSAVKRCIDRGQIPLGALRRLGLPMPPAAVVRPRTQARGPEIPETVVLDDDVLWLLGFFVAEGCRFSKPPKSSFLTFSSDGYLLERAAKILDATFAVHPIAVPPSPGRAPSLFVHSALLVLLFDQLGFGEGPKGIPGWVLGLPLSRLKWFLEGYREGDGVHSGKKLAAAVRHEFSTTSQRLKDDLVIAFGRFGLLPSVGRYTSRIRHKTGEREYPFWRLTLANVAPWSPLAWDRGVIQTLNARRTGDLVWAVVTEIEEVAATGLVYDFCVPGRENFLAGSGVMAHNTYGPRMRPDDGRAVSNFLVQALQGQPLTVYGDGSQTRSFCYVEDEVRGILGLLDSDYVGPMNIGNPNEFTILELAERVLEVTGASSEIVFEPLPEDDPTQRKPDITLAKRLLGWEPTIQLGEGLEHTAAWFRQCLPS